MLKLFLKKINSLLGSYAKFPLPYVIPVYHCVSDEYLPHIKHIINYKNTKDFENDLDDMLKKFEFVTWDFFKDHYNRPSQKPYALLTFDDGLYEFKEVVMPILLRKGIYAVNFVNPAFTDNSDMMFRLKASLIIEKMTDKKYTIPKPVLSRLSQKDHNKNKAISSIHAIRYENRYQLEHLGEMMDLDFEKYRTGRKIYMNADDLKAAQGKGFGIASHSWDHPYFAHLPLNEQLHNIRKSLSYIKENGLLEECFAFPFTDFGLTKELFVKLFAENESLRLTFGTAGVKTDGFEKNLQRIPMENGLSAEREIQFETNYFQLKKIFNKNTIIR